MTHQNLSYSASNSALHDLRWQARIIITKIASEESLSEVKQTYLINKQAFDERQIIIFAVTDNKFDVFGELTKQIKQAEILERLNKAHTLLIGLDGGNKVVYDSFDVRQIFADIDGMPMRRAEINK